MMLRRSRVMALLAAMISAAVAQNSSGSSQTCEALSVDNISPLVVKAEYAVRGRLLARAMELEAVLKAGGGAAVQADRALQHRQPAGRRAEADHLRAPGAL